MIWPFRKMRHTASSLVRRATVEPLDPFYVSRPGIEEAITSVLRRGENLAIYGPPRQGKTTLLGRQLRPTDSVYIECRPGFKRTQIYRVALSSLGYAVLVQKKRRGKASTTVKLGLAGAGAEAGAEAESEQVLQSVTVDLKNPSEVAHLISRITNLPKLVLNNFQLLDSTTKKNLLYDLAFFTERPNIRVVIVGAWSNVDYLEDIEPAVSGKFRYVYVPTWSEEELRRAVAQWSAHAKALDAIGPRLDEFLSLAAGDISLFRALVDSFIEKSGRVAGQSAPPSTTLPIRDMVLGRFRRGLSTKLRSIFAQRGTYITYTAVKAAPRLVANPKFHAIPNASPNDYLRTSINPQTNQPYGGGRSVLLDRKGNPQFIEQPSGVLEDRTTDIACFLLRRFHSAVKQGSTKIGLASLAHDFAEQFLPDAVALDEARLQAVFARFDEVQRRALVVPQMFALDATGDAMEIVDRRLTLFLEGMSIDDLEDVLDDFQPMSVPNVRRRNHVSLNITEEEEAAYIRKAMGEALEKVATSPDSA